MGMKNCKSCGKSIFSYEGYYEEGFCNKNCLEKFLKKHPIKKICNKCSNEFNSTKYKEFLCYDCQRAIFVPIENKTIASFRAIEINNQVAE